MVPANYKCEGQIHLFDIIGAVTENLYEFSWDDDINEIHYKLTNLAAKYRLSIGKAEWEVWDHVPNYGFRMTFVIKITKTLNTEDFFNEVDEIVEFAKERNIELSPMYGACHFFGNDDTANLLFFSTFLDNRKKRKKGL